MSFKVKSDSKSDHFATFTEVESKFLIQWYETANSNPILRGKKKCKTGTIS